VARDRDRNGAHEQQQVGAVASLHCCGWPAAANEGHQIDVTNEEEGGRWGGKGRRMELTSSSRWAPSTRVSAENENFGAFRDFSSALLLLKKIIIFSITYSNFTAIYFVYFIGILKMHIFEKKIIQIFTHPWTHFFLSTYFTYYGLRIESFNMNYYN
jgi:hypothetical protein